MCVSSDRSEKTRYYVDHYRGNIYTRDYWTYTHIPDLLRLKFENSTMQTMFLCAPLSQDFNNLLFLWWQTDEDLAAEVVDDLEVPDHVKTLVHKIKRKQSFIPTLLNILRFDRGRRQRKSSSDRDVHRYTQCCSEKQRSKLSNRCLRYVGDWYMVHLLQDFSQRGLY